MEKHMTKGEELIEAMEKAIDAVRERLGLVGYVGSVMFFFEGGKEQIVFGGGVAGHPASEAPKGQA